MFGLSLASFETFTRKCKHAVGIAYKKLRIFLITYPALRARSTTVLHFFSFPIVDRNGFIGQSIFSSQINFSCKIQSDRSFCFIENHSWGKYSLNIKIELHALFSFHHTFVFQCSLVFHARNESVKSVFNHHFNLFFTLFFVSLPVSHSLQFCFYFNQILLTFSIVKMKKFELFQIMVKNGN